MASVSGVISYSYNYDGLGNRIRQTFAGTPTDYLLDLQPGLAVVLRDKYNDAFGTMRYYTHAPHGLLAKKYVIPSSPNSIWEWAIQDGLGSIRTFADFLSNDAVLASQSYAPYGEPFDGVGGYFPSWYGFTGEWQENNVHLVYLRARYYNAAIGTFASLDPFEGMADRAMSLNGYSWVEGNVPNAVDPSGMIYETPATWNICYAQPPAPDGDNTNCDLQNSSESQCSCEQKCAGAIGSLYVSCVAKCVDNIESQKVGGCKIQVASKPTPTSLSGGHHALIVFTTETNHEIVFRGGPEYSPPDKIGPMGNLWGAIIVEATDWQNSKDSEAQGNIRYTLLAGAEACPKLDCLYCETNRMNNLHAAYYPVKANSNAVAKTFLLNCDMNPIIADELLNVWLPGWDDTSLQ